MNSGNDGDALEATSSTTPSLPSLSGFAKGFVVVLPMVGTAKRAYGTRVAEACRTTMRVLIIDDYKGFRDEVRQMLTRNGHEVNDVESASEAIAPVETGNYDIVLLDYQMPENDGLWFLKHARIPHRTKVLLVTSHTEPRLINEILHAGAAGYLIKPFDEDDLLRNMAFYTNAHTHPLTDTEIAVEESLGNRAATSKESSDSGPRVKRLR